MRNYSNGLLILGLAYVIYSVPIKKQHLHISSEEAKKIGHQIFQNECGGDLKKIIHWNEKEEFISLGFGHFTWQPKGCSVPFQQSFPELVQFMAARGKPLPKQVTTNSMNCPWKTRKEFIEQLDSERIKHLRTYLEDTIDLQIRYMINKLEQEMPKLLEATPTKYRMLVKNRYNALSKMPMGRYALVDYLNFKGAGLQPKEAYNNKGWGLLQVLMRMSSTCKDPVKAFAQAAREVLKERVENAPSAKEKEWLPGWIKRISTYELPALG